MVVQNFEGYFLLAAMVVTGYFFYLLFKPFLALIVLAMTIAVIFYPMFQKVRDGLKGRRGVAALIMCLVVLLIIVLPTSYLVILFKNKTVELYQSLQHTSNGNLLNASAWQDQLITWESFIKEKIPLLEGYTLDFNETINAAGTYVYENIVTQTSALIQATTEIIVSFFFFFITLYYLFKDGDKFTKRLMQLTPLSNKYDRKLFKKFSEVSVSSIVSTIIVAIVQGVITGVGMQLVGLPGFFGGVAASFLALLPLFGASLVWFPSAIYLFVVGSYGAGLFMLLYGLIVVSLVDNFLRPLLIQGKTAIHPLLIFFSIFGGITLWGGFGIVFGPLVLALMLTLLHIYEMEYDHLLEKR